MYIYKNEPCFLLEHSTPNKMHFWHRSYQFWNYLNEFLFATFLSSLISVAWLSEMFPNQCPFNADFSLWKGKNSKGLSKYKSSTEVISCRKRNHFENIPQSWFSNCMLWPNAINTHQNEFENMREKMVLLHDAMHNQLLHYSYHMNKHLHVNFENEAIA